MPIRLVRITEPRPKVIEFETKTLGEYAALSYSWGDAKDEMRN